MPNSIRVVPQEALTTMFSRLKMWRDLKHGQPGSRFQEYYLHRQTLRRSILAKCVTLVAGVVVFLVGLVLMPLPGPGTLVALLGASLLAKEFQGAAKGLDWLEVRIRSVISWANKLRRDGFRRGA